MDRIELMKAFVTVANLGSFTKAAEKLHISNQLASKYVSQLEEHLHVRLFDRTTRRVHLTEVGEQCYQFTQHILEGVRDLEGHIGLLQSHAQGLLRVSAPVSFATLHLAPLIMDFRRENPAVGIDLKLNDRKVDVIEEEFDVALRIGHLKSSSLIAKHITPIRMVICAAPSYLKKYGTPAHPSELIPEHHLRYSYMDYDQDHSPLMEALKKSNQSQGNTGLACDNGEVLTASAIAGEGYVLQPTFIVGEAIKQGKLRTILHAFEPEPMALYAVYPHRKYMATKLRAFVDFSASYFGKPPYWDRFDAISNENSARM